MPPRQVVDVGLVGMRNLCRSGSPLSFSDLLDEILYVRPDLTVAACWPSSYMR